MSIEAAFFGTLGRDAEQKVSKNGKAYLRLNVRGGDGEQAQWVSVLAFDPEAVEIADKFVRGARVYVEGRWSLNEWTNADGVVKTSLSVLSFHTRLSQIGRQKVRRDGPAKPPKYPIRDSYDACGDSYDADSLNHPRADSRRSG